MYVRKTFRKNKNGSTVEYLALAINTWDQERKSSIAKNIYNFGRLRPETRDEMVRLAKSIARVWNLTVIDPIDDGEETSHQPGEDPFPDGVEEVQTRELGIVYVLEAIWNQLGIGEELTRLRKASGCSVEYERALLAMTLNRLSEPESKLGVWDRWLEDKVYLSNGEGLKLHQMYEAMDFLHKHAALLEEVIFFKTADLLNLSVDLIIYDTTTVSFHIDYADEEGDGLRQFGHPKEGGWAPQVIVALAVTREGFPVRSWVFPGNTTDVKTVAKVKADLRGWKLSRCLFFGDAGTNSLENREELARACGTYVLAVRAGSLKEVKEKVLNRRGKYQTVSDNLKVKEVVVGDGVLHRRYFLCYNSSEAKRQRLHRENVISDLEEKLASHQDKSATAKWAIELMASGRYGRYLEINKHGKIYISSKKVKEAARLDGKWVLITNDDTISAQDAAQGYKGMMVIERCFRSLKRTQIKMGPMYHWLPRRIEAHVKICVLALLLQRMVEYKLDEPWFRISRKLRRLQATEYQTETHQFFRRNRVAPEVAAILKKLEISRPKQVMAVVERPS